jgi:hypothetical protein
MSGAGLPVTTELLHRMARPTMFDVSTNLEYNETPNTYRTIAARVAIVVASMGVSLRATHSRPLGREQSRCVVGFFLFNAVRAGSCKAPVPKGVREGTKYEAEEKDHCRNDSGQNR